MIDIRSLSLRQGDFSLSNLDLTIPDGQYGVLMGRSGCGKTTVVECVCGLRRHSSGRIVLGERDVTNLKPGERGVGYVPQDRALFPTLPVRHQLAFSLMIRRRPERDIAHRVRELADWLDIGHLLDRLPDSLSGGEAQRVALGRALASSPRVLCLDEPLNALDEETHDEICELLADIHRQTGVTVLHITHSPSEARRLGSRVLRLERGRIDVAGESRG